MKKIDIYTYQELDKQEQIFISDIKSIAGQALRQAYHVADLIMIVRNWLIGWRIFEQEQKGKERAEYGKRVLEIASSALTEEFGKGFSVTGVKNMRRFYVVFKDLQIGQALLDQFGTNENQIGQAMLAQLKTQQANHSESFIPLLPNLSWMHYERLMRIKDEQARFGICEKQRKSNGITAHWLATYIPNTIPDFCKRLKN